MQTFEILLKKRPAKSVFYIIAAFFGLFILGLLGVSIFTKYAWWQLLLLGIILIGLFITIKGLYEYLFYGEVKLVAESAGGKLKFYNLNADKKKFNKSREYNLDEISRIYAVRKTSRFLYKNYYYEFEGKKKLAKFFKEIIEVFPPLFEATDADRSAVLLFIKSQNPEIQIGIRVFTRR